MSRVLSFFSAPKFWHDECLMIRANVPRKNGDFCSCRPCAPTCRSMIWQLGTYLPSLFFAARMHKWSVILCWLVALTYFSHLQPISGGVGHRASSKGCPGLQIGARNLRGDLPQGSTRGMIFRCEWMGGRENLQEPFGFTVPQTIAAFL